MGEDMLVLEVERGVMKSSYCIAVLSKFCPLVVGGAIYYCYGGYFLDWIGVPA